MLGGGRRARARSAPCLALLLGLLIGRGLVALVSRTINDLYFVVAVNELALPPRRSLEGVRWRASRPPSLAALAAGARSGRERPAARARALGARGARAAPRAPADPARGAARRAAGTHRRALERAACSPGSSRSSCCCSRWRRSPRRPCGRARAGERAPARAREPHRATGADGRGRLPEPHRSRDRSPRHGADAMIGVAVMVESFRGSLASGCCRRCARTSM